MHSFSSVVNNSEDNEDTDIDDGDDTDEPEDGDDDGGGDSGNDDEDEGLADENDEERTRIHNEDDSEEESNSNTRAGSSSALAVNAFSPLLSPQNSDRIGHSLLTVSSTRAGPVSSSQRVTSLEPEPETLMTLDSDPVMTSSLQSEATVSCSRVSFRP